MCTVQHPVDDVSHSTCFQRLSLNLIGPPLTPEGSDNITNTIISLEY